VRDHVNCCKNGRWRSYRFYRALQRLKSLTCDICEIFGALRFSSFSTQSAHRDISLRCRIWSLSGHSGHRPSRINQSRSMTTRSRLTSRQDVRHEMPSPISGRARRCGSGKLPSAVNAICPVQPYQQKNFAFAVGQISSTSSPRPFPARGALAIVTNAGWDAVDAAASARMVIAGRVSRERATGAQDERRWLRTAKPCGPDTRCWCQVERRRSQLNPPTTVTRRIRRRGEQGISRKAIAQGK
jgi:hypothetical protein